MAGGAPLWKPGIAPYALWINNLKETDPAGYQAHLLERKQRKLIKKAMAEVVDAQQDKWIALFHNAALKLLNKAVENGDTAAYAILHDRYIGKSVETVISDSNQVLPWSDMDGETKDNDDAAK